GEIAGEQEAQAAVWTFGMTHFGREELKPAWSDTHCTTSLFLAHRVNPYTISVWLQPNKYDHNPKLIFEPL
ncbi:hypothetical protein FRB94_013941, partial [Tulasnella sp. JGI-2019a]